MGNRALDMDADMPSGSILKVISAMLKMLVDAVFEKVKPARAPALR